MSRFLVTGGAGFIGSNFIRHLLAKDPDCFVINLDKLTYAGNLANLESVSQNPRYQFVRGDVCDTSLVRRLMGQVDWVVHFASETHVDRSIDSAEDFIETNIRGTQVLLDAAREQCHIHRFIHFSTDEVYGSTVSGEFSETSRFNPSSPYAASKAAGDLLVQAYVKTHRTPAIILRGCNNFGPYQYPEKVIPLFITNLIENKKIPVYGNGENSREWMYVEETCRAILFVCDKGQIGQVYNVGSGDEMRNIDLARKLLSLLKKDETSIAFVKDRLGHDWRYKLNSNKLRNLGFEVSGKFDVHLRETVDWYLAQKSWWGSLKKDVYTIK